MCHSNRNAETAGPRRTGQTRRAFLKTAGLTVGAAACVWGRDAGAYAKPNIVLIMADDLGYGDLGCYGNDRIRTPHIDALAASGVRFTDFHSNGPVCSPTRAALLTGRYQQRCGLEGVVTAKNHRHTGMALEETTFAESLKQAGYATGLFGKWHLGYDVAFNPIHQGFDEFRGYVSGNVDYHSHVDQVGYEDWWNGRELAPEAGYSTDLISAHGVDFIERHGDEPFCLYLAHEAPHYPYQGRQDKADRTAGKPRPVHEGRQDRTGAYREMIEAMDEGVGRIAAALGRLNLLERTFVFFCSDNGAGKEGSNAPLRGSKGSLWEGGHRVPAIASWPGTIPSGHTVDDAAMTMDLFPTFTDVAGAPTPEGLDGMSLLPLLRDGHGLPERTLLWRFRGMKAARRGSLKLVVEPGPGGSPQTHLYDLDADLAEQEDLSTRLPEQVTSLSEELADWEADVDAGVTPRT
ncbi:MAG: sulfatase-like hydrolase/transferase [bacterium]|nr:sulfatase-like hydrolase/transferase [bacterium]